MNLHRLSTHALAALATSYVTLGIADPSEAERLWAWYAISTFGLSCLNLWRQQRPC